MQLEFEKIIGAQRQYFNQHKTLEVNFRLAQLNALKQLLQSNESALYGAIEKDFQKSAFDTFTTELSFIYREIDFFIYQLPKLARPKRVSTNLINQWGSSHICPEPLGVCLIIGAWNYPYQLTLLPAIAAIAAGNTCIIKPSELAPHSSHTLTNLINAHFPSHYLHVLELNDQQTSQLLDHRVDKIFFTGSTRVGQLIYAKAAQHLTPVTLELGGKSPVIVSRYANLAVAAKRIVWGKFLNSGQTCIAPDYLFVDKPIKEEFVSILLNEISKNAYHAESPHYTRIINDKHFNRLQKLLSNGRILCGGKTDAHLKYISPTVLDEITWDHAIMQEEIFGPLLPIMTFEDFHELISEMPKHEKPLAAYLFSNNRKEQALFRKCMAFGGGCINDVVMHISNPNLPFGGVGQSGFGKYHGKFGFETFSHTKAILKRATWGEPAWKYPPYTSGKLRWLMRLLRP